MLKKLAQAGDPQAKKIFKDEIATRFSSNYWSVQTYLIEQGYLNLFNKEELDTLLTSSKTDKDISQKLITLGLKKEISHESNIIMENFMNTPFPENIIILKDDLFRFLSDSDIDGLIDYLAFYNHDETKALTNLSLIYIYYDLKGQSYKPYRINSHFLKTKTITSKFWNQVGETYSLLNYPERANQYYKKSAEIQ